MNPSFFSPNFEMDLSFPTDVRTIIFQRGPSLFRPRPQLLSAYPATWSPHGESGSQPAALSRKVLASLSQRPHRGERQPARESVGSPLPMLYDDASIDRCYLRLKIL